MCQHVKLSARH